MTLSAILKYRACSTYHEKYSKFEKVFFIEKDSLSAQCESISARYMNRFAIEEDGSFEIAAIQTVARSNGNDLFDHLDKAMQAVENLTKLQTEGLDYFIDFKITIFFVF